MIEIRELRIGNIVQFSSIIDKACNVGNMMYRSATLSDGEHITIPYSINEIYEVILTGDFLLGNGFEHQNGRFIARNGLEVDDALGWYVELRETERCWILHVDNYATDNFGHYDGMVSCVHHLQNILTDCGLTELADNFKVK